MEARTELLDIGHVVQFYGHEEELADQVAGYLRDALQRDGVAVVIATAAHRRAFEGRLRQAGVDLAAAVRSGTYLALDASDTVHALMPGGRLDRDAFDRVVGGLIRRAGQQGRPVRAYGEMVTLLWDAGLVNAAVQLEEMWDSLGLRHSFSLFCSYPASSVSGDGHLEAFAEVCRLHHSVVGGWPAPAAPGATRTFAWSGDAPAAARHFAVDAVRRLERRGPGRRHRPGRDRTGRQRHGARTYRLHGGPRGRPGRAADLGARREPAAARAAAAGLPAVPLHGLGAVAALARRWGVEPLGHSGKSVWVELRR